ncbi:MAG: hypothetical protein RL338_1869 [Chloroflexota bacterium]
MDQRLVGTLLVVVAAAGFGSGALFAKGVYGASEIGFLTLMLWRFLLGAGATWIWIAASARRRAAVGATDRRLLASGLLLGVLYTGGSATYFAGLETVSASLAALIVFIYPALSGVLSLRFGRRLEGRRAWSALALALVGCVLTIGGIPTGEVPPLGPLLLVIASPIIYSFWLLLQAWLTGERRGGAASGRVDAEPVVIAAAVNSGAAGAYLAVALLVAAPIVPATSDPGVLAMIGGIGFFSTFVAIVGVTEGSRRIGAANAALVSTVEPLWTIALGAFLLGESLTPVQLIGGALILVGVIVAQTRPRGAREAAWPMPRIADE